MTDHPFIEHAAPLPATTRALLRLSWERRPELWCPECGRHAPKPTTPEPPPHLKLNRESFGVSNFPLSVPRATLGVSAIRRRVLRTRQYLKDSAASRCESAPHRRRESSIPRHAIKGDHTMANPVSTTNKTATEWRPSSDPKSLTPGAVGNLLASIKAEKVKGKPDQERYFDLIGRAENAAGHLAREINAAYNHISNEQRDMLASEVRTIREMEASAELLEKSIAEWRTLEPPLAGLAGPSSGPTNYAEGKP